MKNRFAYRRRTGFPWFLFRPIQVFIRSARSVRSYLQAGIASRYRSKRTACSADRPSTAPVVRFFQAITLPVGYVSRNPISAITRSQTRLSRHESMAVKLALSLLETSIEAQRKIA